MPITRKVEAAYYASDGSRYATVQEAQVAELVQLINKTDGSAFIDNTTGGLPILAKGILEEADAYLAILTTGPRSRPKARRVAGTTSPKRAARRATAEQVSNGIAAMREAVDNQPVEAA